MKTSTIVSYFLAATGAAVGSPVQAAAPSKPFGLIAARSGSPIHLQGIEANGGNFWIGKKPNTFCPVKPSECPKGDYTGFGQSDDLLYLSVEVPGGQQVYIDPATGALKFSIPHSSTPANGVVHGFSVSKGGSTQSLQHKGGFLACPVGKVYRIYVQTKNFSQKNCLGFDAIVSPAKNNKPVAFQYD